MFKKGNKVTIVASWDQFGSVYVRHYIVSSWGKKQATLVRLDDGSNAEFRVYTEDANRVQGIHSRRIIATADYSDALALQFAAEFIADEDARAERRWVSAQERASKQDHVPYAGTKDQELAYERGVYDRHKAITRTASIK